MRKKFHVINVFSLSHFRLDCHLVTCHRYPSDQHRCDSCSRGFAWRPLLVRHRALIHGDLRKYPCENCPKVTTSSSQSKGDRCKTLANISVTDDFGTKYHQVTKNLSRYFLLKLEHVSIILRRSPAFTLRSRST